MIVVMEHSATAEQVDRVIETMVEHGYDVHRSTGAEHIILGAIGRVGLLDPAEIELLPGVRQVVVISQSYRRVERSAFPQGRLVRLGQLTLGGADIGLIPFLTSLPERKWVEDFTGMEGNPSTVALRLESGTDQSFIPGEMQSTLELWKRSALTLIIDIADTSHWRMHSTLGNAFILRRAVWMEETFLREAVKTGKPLLLHVPTGYPLEEVLIAADRLFRRDFPDVVLAVSFGGEGAMVPTLNPELLLQLKKNTFLPILADFSGSGLLLEKLKILCQAAIACGADGIIGDMHSKAKSLRALDNSSYGLLMERLKKIAAVVR